MTGAVVVPEAVDGRGLGEAAGGLFGLVVRVTDHDRLQEHRPAGVEAPVVGRVAADVGPIAVWRFAQAYRARAGYPHRHVPDHDPSSLGLEFEEDKDHIGTALEWGVRVLDKPVVVHAEGDRPEPAKADIFPAYDDDGGLLVVLTPK